MTSIKHEITVNQSLLSNCFTPDNTSSHFQMPRGRRDHDIIVCWGTEPLSFSSTGESTLQSMPLRKPAIFIGAEADNVCKQLRTTWAEVNIAQAARARGQQVGTGLGLAVFVGIFYLVGGPKSDETLSKKVFTLIVEIMMGVCCGYAVGGPVSDDERLRLLKVKKTDDDILEIINLKKEFDDITRNSLRQESSIDRVRENQMIEDKIKNIDSYVSSLFFDSELSQKKVFKFQEKMISINNCIESIFSNSELPQEEASKFAAAELLTHVNDVVKQLGPERPDFPLLAMESLSMPWGKTIRSIYFEPETQP